jgi:ubiquinone/menaquinone biosynthesis C-methylase UbiE
MPPSPAPLAPARLLAAALGLLLALRPAAAQRPLPADVFPAPTRPVASIVAPRWIDEPVRDQFDEAATVLRALGVRRGMTVADIGAGDGYYVSHLVPLLGDSGRVYAVDVTPRYLDLLRTRIRQQRWTTVEPILGAAHDPRLPDGRVDVALMIHMYHEIAQPFGLLYHLAYALTPEGLVGIVDQEAPPERHGTPTPLLRCEFEAMGYRYVRRDVLSDGAYLVTFRAPAAGARLTSAEQVRDRVTKARCRA